MKRPNDVYEDIYNGDGRSFRQDSAYIAVQGRLGPGKHTLRGDVSSQFISGLLFLLPTLDGDSEIVLSTPLQSAPYVELTLKTLELAGVKAEPQKDGNGAISSIIVPGKQRWSPFRTTIEADWSSAAPLLAAAKLCGKNAEVNGLNYDSPQADRVITKLLDEFGEYGNFKAIQADISDCPDLGPLLFAMATQAEGTSVFRGTRRLRFKESDRIANMERELKKLGCTISADEDSVTVTGPTAIKGGVTVSGCGDHRIVMALAVPALTAEKPVTIEGADAVSKSFPGFFAQLGKLGTVHVK
jgi:3-phosphoshikimate 1-carboxyvinyltransferase